VTPVDQPFTGVLHFKQMHTIPFPEKVRLPWGLNTTIALDKELHFCETRKPSGAGISEKFRAMY
jgi:hypothetical protein